MAETGAAYRRYLEDPRFEVAILTHGSTQYATTILEHIGLGGLIPQEGIIGLDKTDLALKSTSPVGFETAMRALGLDPEEVKQERPNNVFFADEAPRNLIIPHDMGIRTIHVGDNIHETEDKEVHPYVNFRFQRLLGFFQTYNLPEPQLKRGLAYHL